jgi:hypothetical protein
MELIAILAVVVRAHYVIDAPGCRSRSCQASHEQHHKRDDPEQSDRARHDQVKA